MKNNFRVCILFLCFASNIFAQTSKNNTSLLQFVFTSDAHYGITRSAFHGATNVDAHLVNAAMVDKINSLAQLTLPTDSGVNQGQRVGPIDFIVEGGDIANRMEGPVQPAAKSWEQFEQDYLKGIKLTDHTGQSASFYIVPGNHDISNAIGFYRPMVPTTDPSSMINIYNLMMQPAIPKTIETFHYPEDRINYSKDLGGIHFMFINLWPDSVERIWMENDLKKIPTTIPVILVTHDQPVCEAKHFDNPDEKRGINGQDKFEDLLVEKYKDGSTASTDGGKTDIEQLGLVAFLKSHPNIKAYFHGNSNYNEYYVYRGPNNDIDLNVFRVDSPMKGKYSSKDERKLSFQLVSINTNTGAMTVRECLWDTDPTNPDQPIQWGTVKTVSLK
ncbi:MAG: metallophosphoesterase [Bacteroidetes bacterium]|nr:metallophosphoesterase [Bacteroidota bacterium]